METTSIAALFCSGADLLHGPLAMVDNISPAIAVVTDGRGADPLMAGPQAQVEAASAGFVLPAAGGAEEVQPIVEILPLRLPAYEVTVARDQDPDAPRALAAVTETH